MKTGKQAGNTKGSRKLDIRSRQPKLWSPFGSKKNKMYTLEKTGPVKLIHTLLFVIENTQGSRQRDDFIAKH